MVSLKQNEEGGYNSDGNAHPDSSGGYVLFVKRRGKRQQNGDT
jgi:hypothetical protein